ncbi:MAG: folate-binding protein YgfZ [Rhodospirillales bacterium]
MTTTQDSGAEDLQATWLEDRGIIALSGEDARGFLQGVVSNDVSKVTPTRALWAAFLTPQGKYLHDFFLLEKNGSLLIETEAARLPDLLRRLKLYKLRSKVVLEDQSERWRVAAVWGDGAAERFGLDETAGQAAELGEGLAFVDPRQAGLGLRLLVGAEKLPDDLAPAPRAAWDARRIALGLPDGSRDMEIEKALLLENGFDELGGVDWKKGCYMGQELTARTKYRGLVKKRLLPIASRDGRPLAGTKILQAGKEVGELRSQVEGQGLALLRLQALATGEPLTLEGREVEVRPPDWVVLPQAKAAAS